MTRTLTALTALALCAACSEEIETYDPGADLFEEWAAFDEELQQGVPSEMEIQIQTDGANAIGSITGADPDVRIWVITGDYGEGLCPRVLRGACLSVRSPSPVTVVQSSQQGEALFSFAPPSDVFHKPYQAVVIRQGRAEVTDVAWATSGE